VLNITRGKMNEEIVKVLLRGFLETYNYSKRRTKVINLKYT